MRSIGALSAAVVAILTCVCNLPAAEQSPAQRFREKLDRGIVAVPSGVGKVYVGWRLLQEDPPDVAFNVYRKAAGAAEAVKLNAEPVTRTTDFVDATAPAGTACEYSVRSLTGGKELPPSPAVTATARSQPESQPAKAKSSRKDIPWASYVSIPLLGKYSVKDVGVADLDGDGGLDYVIKQPEISIDPYESYWKPSPGTYKLEAYRHDGKALWQHDLGVAIEQGVWYSPYLVYDFDGDGKAEVAVKIGEGDTRDANGRVFTGPEYLAILDGQTGKEIARADWPSRDLFAREGYNKASRNQLCVAYLDGKTPAIIINRGTYKRMIVEAWTFQDRKLRKLWQWDNEKLPSQWQGQGSHMLQAADIYGDGFDEVIIGSCVLDHNGKELWTTGLGHPDSVYVGKLDPSREGLQIYYNIETKQKKNGMCMVDAATGKLLWGYDKPTMHVHSHGLCSDLDPAHPGWECYGADSNNHKFVTSWLWDAKGNLLSDSKKWNFGPFPVLWDADPQRELMLDGLICKYDGSNLNQYNVRILAVADILGDWREEIIACVDGELRILVSTIPATTRRPCLLQDPIYRMCTVRQTSGYYQVPTMTFDPATEMKPK